MKTLQEQYNLIKEGKGNKNHFFKSALHLFPDVITPVNTFEDTVRILKNRGIIAEGVGGVVTKGKTPDWHAIFKENINSLHEEKEPRKGDKVEVDGKKGTVIAAYSERGANFEQYDVKLDDGKERKGLQAKDLKILKEAKEAKAIEKETTKDVTDMATRGCDYKDTKKYDNVFGQEFLKGFYTEMQDEKNKDKDVNELRAIVAKNLAKDLNYYVKDGQFGVKGVGYTTDVPGLGETKPAKGKHKASGYGDLKESVLRSQIHLLVKEILAEGIHDRDITSAPHTNVKGEMGDYDPKARAASLARLANFGPKSKPENTDEALGLEDEMAFSQAVDFAEDLYDKVGNVEDVLANLPQQFIQYKDELEQHLTQKFEG